MRVGESVRVSLVIDASVVLKFFGLTGERHQDAADRSNAAWANGDVDLVAPTLLSLEFLNSLGRRHGLSEASLKVALASLDDFGIRMYEPDLHQVAHWISRGLTSSDADAALAP